MSKTVMQKLNEGRQFRNIDVSNIEHRTAEDGALYVEGYATVFDTPYLLYEENGWKLFEVVERGAFDDADMSDVVMQYDHEGRVFARTSNGTLEVAPDEKGLHIRARLDGTELGKQIYDEIAGGFTNKMSFGFTISNLAREREETENNVVVTHRIKGVRKLFDVSAVSVPANDATTINARNLFNGVKEEVAAERLKREKLKTRIKLENIKNELFRNDN